MAYKGTNRTLGLFYKPQTLWKSGAWERKPPAIWGLFVATAHPWPCLALLDRDRHSHSTASSRHTDLHVPGLIPSQSSSGRLTRPATVQTALWIGPRWARCRAYLRQSCSSNWPW
jgi:hypothetical protein